MMGLWQIVGESSLALISWFQVSEGVDAEGAEGGWVLKGCSYGGGLRQCIAENEVAVNWVSGNGDVFGI